MKKCLRILTTVCGLFLTLALLYQSIASFSLTLKNYPSSPPFDEMALELTQYLSGRVPSLSPLFTERETAHMVDVLHLYQLGKWVSIIAVLTSIFALSAAWRILGAPTLIRQFRIGMGLFFALVFFLAFWAAIDFNGWFVVMHKIAFTNDLWLLDPNESMLIQMLPIEFFMRAVRNIALRFLLNAACVAVATVLIKKFTKRGAV